MEKKLENLLGNLRKITFKKKITEHVALRLSTTCRQNCERISVDKVLRLFIDKLQVFIDKLQVWTSNKKF